MGEAGRHRWRWWLVPVRSGELPPFIGAGVVAHRFESVRDVVPVIGCGCGVAHQFEGVAGGHPEGCELLTP